MRVIHLIKTADGASWAVRQVRELIGLGHEVHVVVPGEGNMTPKYYEVGASVHYLPCDIDSLRNPFAFLRRAKDIRKLVLAIKPDIIHSHFVGTSMMMRAALAGLDTPRLFQVPGPLHLENRITRWAERITSSSRDYWIASCKKTQQIYIDQGINADRVGLAYYGSDFTQMGTSQKGALRSELSIAGNELVVGMVAYAYAPKRWLGYTRGIKGHEDLIDAIALLHDRGIHAHGVFVGGPWANSHEYFSEIVAYGRRKLGRFAHFLGTRHDVEVLYDDFDVVVHPSHSENLGGAGESLALAVPTIATNIGGFPDIVIDKNTGWLTPAKNPYALSKTIEEVLKNPDKSLEIALNGQVLVKDMLDSRNTALKIDAIYDAVINNRSLQF